MTTIATPCGTSPQQARFGGLSRSRHIEMEGAFVDVHGHLRFFRVGSGGTGVAS
jgi:hypothetical protein